MDSWKDRERKKERDYFRLGQVEPTSSKSKWRHAHFRFRFHVVCCKFVVCIIFNYTLLCFLPVSSLHSPHAQHSAIQANEPIIPFACCCLQQFSVCLFLKCTPLARSPQHRLTITMQNYVRIMLILCVPF